MAGELVWVDHDFYRTQNRVITCGQGETWLIKRPGVETHGIPLPSIDVAESLIPELNSILGIGAGTTIYVDGVRMAKKNPPGCSPFVYDEGSREGDGFTVQFVHFGGSNGNDFYVAPQGRLLWVGEEPGGFMMRLPHPPEEITGWELRHGRPHFELPSDGKPFWVHGSTGIVGDEESFYIGGRQYHRIDQYRYDGQLIRSIKGYSWDGAYVSLTDRWIGRLRLDRWRRLWVSYEEGIVILSPSGEAVHQIEWADVEIGPDTYPIFDGFNVDSKGRLWAPFGDAEGTHGLACWGFIELDENRTGLEPALEAGAEHVTGLEPSLE